MIAFQGEIAALSAACLWAVASVIYSRLGQSIPPLQLNLLKGAIAIPLVLLTIFLGGVAPPTVSPIAICLMLLSGAIGIGLGDTAFFAALKCLGARRALLMETLSPPLAAILALLLFQEQLSTGAWCGILLTILGVAWVISERVPNSQHASKDLIPGVGFGLVAAIALAVGAVLAHGVLDTTTLSPLWAELLRLSAGVVVLLPWTWRGRHYASGYEALRSTKVAGGIFVAALIGTYLAIWLQQTALKFTAAGITLTLTNTSPLFVLPLAACLGERISWRAVLGVLVAIAGIGLLFAHPSYH